MNHYKATTREDYCFIASLFRDGNNEFLIRKEVSCDDVEKEHMDPNIHTFILQEDENKIGWISLVFKPKSKKVSFGMIIDKPYQGKGFGTQSMLILEQEAKHLGATLIELDVYATNERAIDLYQRTGFQETRQMAHMEKRIL